MSLLDRYVTRQFLLNFVILLFVLMSLFVLIELMLSLDDFLEAGQRLARGSAWAMGSAETAPTEVQDAAGPAPVREVLAATLWAIWDWNAPLVLLIYVYLAGLVVVAAIGFTFADLARKGELVAVLTSGVSLYRVAAPVLVAGGLLGLTALPIQELLIPREAGRLARPHGQIGRADLGRLEVRFVADGDGNLFSAASFDPETGTLSNVHILLRAPGGLARAVIVAEQAVWRQASGGWDLIQGYRQDAVVAAAGIASVPVTSPAQDVPEVSFIASRLTPQVLIAHRAEIYPSLLSSAELRRLGRGGAINPAVISGIVHRRFSFPVVNLLVMLSGLPFFLSREPVNLLAQAARAAAVCIGGWASALVILQIGAQQLRPEVAAWLPVVLYLPLTVWLLQRIKT